jgi:hypothetical protein
MISLELSTIRSKDIARFENAVAIAAYLSRGGVIHQIETNFQFVPKPIVQAGPAPTDQREALRAESYARQIAELAARKEIEDRIRKLAETMTYQEAKVASGYSQAQLYRISRAGGFHFRRKPAEVKNKRAYIDPAVDARLCERLIALRDIGLNRHQVAKQMEISASVITRLMRDYAIDFPSAKPRKCAA